MPESILELDIHGMTQVQAKTAIDAKLRRAGSGACALSTAITAVPPCGT